MISSRESAWPVESTLEIEYELFPGSDVQRFAERVFGAIARRLWPDIVMCKAAGDFVHGLERVVKMYKRLGE